MRRENEVVNPGLLMRFVCGALVLVAIWAIGRRVAAMLAGAPTDGWTVAGWICASYALFLFGGYALTGKVLLPKRRDQA